MSLKFYAILVTSILLFSSCSDMSKSKKNPPGVDITNLISCELDAKAFENIATQNIESDIICLQSQIHSFLELVETDRPGFVNQRVLKDFLLTGPIEIDAEELLPMIDAVFDLSYLVFDMRKGEISRAQFDSLISFLSEVNKNLFPLFSILKESDPEESELSYADYLYQRRQLLKYSRKILDSFKTLFEKSSEAKYIVIEPFLSNLVTEEVMRKIQSVLFAKPLILGGLKDRLSVSELEGIIFKAHDMVALYYDISHLSRFGFLDDFEKMLSVLESSIYSLKQVLDVTLSSDDHVGLFSFDDIINALEIFDVGIGGIDLSKYKTELMMVKRVLLKTQGEFFTPTDMRSIMNILYSQLDKGEFFHRIFSHYKNQILTRAPLSLNLSGFPVMSAQEQVYKDQFARIIHEYRFFKGDRKTAFFGFDYDRNEVGIFEIALLEFAISELMQDFGQRDDRARGGYHMTLDQTYQMVRELRHFLADHGIIYVGRKGGGEMTKTSENIVLMSTLFQFQSNGCDKNSVCMEVVEFTEFLQGVLISLNLKSTFTDALRQRCADSLDPYGRVLHSCFEREFFNVINDDNIDGKGFSMKEYFPLVTSYMKELIGNSGSESSNEFKNFLFQTESFTRACTHFSNGDTVPLSDADAFSVFAGLLNIESTMIRFDLNQNGQLDAPRRGFNEVMHAYDSLYKNAIEGLVAPNGGFMRRLSLSIFKYLIMYGKVPDQSQFKSIWQYIRFIMKFNKRAPASRTTIATILKTLGQQSDSAKEHPFKCDECLMNPEIECIPEGDEWYD